MLLFGFGCCVARAVFEIVCSKDLPSGEISKTVIMLGSALASSHPGGPPGISKRIPWGPLRAMQGFRSLPLNMHPAGRY